MELRYVIREYGFKVLQYRTWDESIERLNGHEWLSGWTEWIDVEVVDEEP